MRLKAFRILYPLLTEASKVRAIAWYRVGQISELGNSIVGLQEAMNRLEQLQ